MTNPTLGTRAASTAGADVMCSTTSARAAITEGARACAPSLEQVLPQELVRCVPPLAHVLRSL